MCIRDRGKSVRTVGTKAFAYDQKLKYVQLTDGLQQIGASAFTGCTALKVLEMCIRDRMKNAAMPR